MKDSAIHILSGDSQSHGKTFLPALVLSHFTIWPLSLIASLLLIDIGMTFNQPVGVVGQVQTAASFFCATAAILTGAWSVRVPSKSLLLIGVGSLTIAAVGSAVAVNFPMIITTYTIYGLGWGRQFL